MFFWAIIDRSLLVSTQVRCTSAASRWLAPRDWLTGPERLLLVHAGSRAGCSGVSDVTSQFFVADEYLVSVISLLAGSIIFTKGIFTTKDNNFILCVVVHLDCCLESLSAATMFPLFPHHMFNKVSLKIIYTIIRFSTQV